MSRDYYLNHINAYEAAYQPWLNRGEKIVKRYKDERGVNSKKQQFNILWSNVQTLAPALYDREPNPNIERRHQDDDDLGRVVSDVLERSVNYFIRTEDFNEVMQQVVLDRLLPGRGVAWVRYVPIFTQPEQITSSIDDGGAEQDLYSEDVVFDYVDVCDFGHNIARTWKEVDLVWRKAYMGRRELIKRFKNGEQIPLDAKEKGSDDSKNENGKKATIYELWDKKTKRVVWLHKEYPELLDVKDDPLRLKHFFPCPKPIYSTLANKNLIPTPDYVQYQDQAMELDKITGRIALLVSALKVAGVYDASAEGIQKILSDNEENKLYPVDSWAMFAEKGGLKGAIDFLPIEQIAGVLTGLYAARDKVKQDIYEITGISDIIRGASNPNETLGAQELKGKYAGLRLGAMQRDVARFARDLVEMATEIIAEHFDMEIIKQISGVKLLTAVEKQQITIATEQHQQLVARAQQAQQPLPPLPFDKKTMNLMKQPLWEDVEGVIRNDIPRCFIIDIETDSTIKVDQDAEKTARTEFLTATGSFIQQATQIQDPALKPLLMEMLMFGVRGFKAGRELESAFKNTMDDMRERDDQPKQPDPQLAEMQQAAADKEHELALKSKEIDLKGAEVDVKRGDLNLRGMEIKNKAAYDMQDIAIREKELLLRSKEIDADIEKHRISINADIVKSVIEGRKQAETQEDNGEPNTADIIAGVLQQESEKMADGFRQIAEMNMQNIDAVVEAINKPKVTTIIRDLKTKELIGSEQRTE